MDAVVVLAEGFEEIEAASPVDILRRAGVEVTVLAAGSTDRVRGAHGLEFVADGMLDAYAGTPRAVVLPGGMPGATHLAHAASLRPLLERVRAAGGCVAALCASPAVVLGPWGFLKGRVATCYPSFRDQLPADARVHHGPVAVDGALVTGRDPGAAAAFALAVAEWMAGAPVADEVARGMGVERCAPFRAEEASPGIC